jgi:hypothetical protein
MGAKVEVLKQFQDFILFKESSDNIITQGTFDNKWKLPAEAASAMKTTGAVTIKD